MVYSDVAQNPKKLTGALNMLDSYEHYPRTAKPYKLPKSLASVMSQKKFEESIYNEIERLRQQVQDKCHQRRRLLDRNPYRMWTMYLSRTCGWFGFKVLSCLLWPCGLRPDDKASLFAYLIYFPLVYIFTLLFFVAGLIGFIMDIFTCRLFQQHCQQDIAYNKRIMDENPHLDSKVLDKELHDGIANLAASLQAKYPQYHVHPWFGKDIIHLKNSNEYVQRFLICFSEKGASDNGVIQLHVV